ncbi:hypothetical protein [Streptomyces capoamus]|uniref:hypothetical protein n=1 Tax=Streptomyces capoamus TaxID=68183 RepID=UPI001679AF3C|nr:hypothetical protein [Streptomyces capoamus]
MLADEEPGFHRCGPARRSRQAVSAFEIRAPRVAVVLARTATILDMTELCDQFLHYQ